MESKYLVFIYERDNSMLKFNTSTAYFSMEFGLNNDFKIYAGGLGVLAGDYLKAAKDNNLPVIGVGIKWKQGYVEQYIEEDNKIVDAFYNNEYSFLKDTKIKVSVRIRDRDVWCKVWKVECFNNAELYLLDTDLPENHDRWITGQLYGWFEEERIAQEMVLGIGGVRALRALHKDVNLYHLNEGHTVFAAFELINEKIRLGCNAYDAWSMTKNQIVFTTHTPAFEGTEFHGLNILEYMGAFNGLSSEFVRELGGEPFNMVAAALRLSRKANAVSSLHGKFTNEMWKELHRRCDIISITNGIHIKTWADREILNAYNKGLDLWKPHMNNKQKLIDYIESIKGVKFDINKLIIGFARRAATYKRADLIFKDEEIIRPLLESKTIQLVFSSKAHPLDFASKETIKHILEMEKKYPDSVVFIENYDMYKSAILTKGVDVWLNNPRVNKETCGTCGMKAAVNGVINFSTLGGWWNEACWDGVTGFKIDDGFISKDIEEMDRHDANSLYDVLINKIIKIYYNDNEKWKNMMYCSIKAIIDNFSSDRMIEAYYTNLYR